MASRFALLLLLGWFYVSGAVSAIGYERGRPAVLLIGIAMFVFGAVLIPMLASGFEGDSKGGSK